MDRPKMGFSVSMSEIIESYPGMEVTLPPGASLSSSSSLSVRSAAGRLGGPLKGVLLVLLLVSVKA